MNKFTPSIAAQAVLLAAFALVPVAAGLLDSPHYLTLFGRILVFAIAAIGLDLILGYGGLASFGHAAFVGIGAYAVAILHFHGIDSGPLQLAAALLGAALIGGLIGAVSVRSSGIYFIMITLAFAQMLYFLANSVTTYGGSDGMNLQARSQFGWLDLKDPVQLYYAIFGVFLALLFLLGRLVNSRLGMVLRGIKSNEPRLRSLGYPVYAFKILFFVLSAMICALSGLLLANLTDFVTSDYMRWARSGDLLIMVILGGMGTLIGPLAGATVLLLFEEILASYTQHWALALGPLFLLIVLFAKQGIWGALPRAWRRK
jgi:branched-chain amino acid transport system permease protein